LKRRHWMWGGVAVAAGLAGAGWRGWSENRKLAAQDAATGGLWQMSFAAPDEGQPEVVMQSFRGQPLLLNFWGSWCPPCVLEMPDLDRFAKSHATQGWRVLGLAVDNPKAVREFLTRAPVSYTIGLAGFEGAELTRRLGNSQGGLPYTVAFNAMGDIVHRKAGQTHLEELQQWARTL